MRKVFCAKFGQELEGLDSPPFPGKLGQIIFNQVSKRAWEEWKDLEIKIVNEYRLNLAYKEDYEALKEQMIVFLGLKEGEVLKTGDPDKGKSSQ
ncbi:MAG: oxidative damage protection protein [Deltaproteobacteria bacterium]|nr:oxidative damage protection protein [Deltaproteobacteria bacterium]